MLRQGVKNISVFEYYSNSWNKQQYLYLVIGFSQYRMVFDIWYLCFFAPQIVFGYSNSWTKYLFKQFHIFSEQNVLSWTNTFFLLVYYFYFFLFIIIWYLVFGIQIFRPNSTISIQYSYFLDNEKYLVFGIRISSIPNSI